MTGKKSNSQNNKRTSHKNNEVKLFQPAQMNICQSNICRRELGWSYFNAKPSFWEKL